MKPKYIAAGCTLMGLLVAPALSAQDIYRVTDMANEDLNGTARFVGMGGALSALGADMSVMSTNPAGIGLFRSSDVSVTAGLRRQIEGNAFAGRDVVNLSFDQAGFVYSIRTGGKNVFAIIERIRPGFPMRCMILLLGRRHTAFMNAVWTALFRGMALLSTLPIK